MNNFKYFHLILLFLALNVKGQESIKRLYLANDTHTDLMWNGDEKAWYNYNLDMARFYLKLGEDTKNNSPEARSKWNYDVAWTLYMMEKNTSKDFFNRIIRQIQNEQASVPYNFTLAVYGGSTMESVLRSFYYGGQLERKYGINIDLAVCQENATLPLGLASLWAGSGAKYSWRGVCNCATKINTIGYRDHEIYWYKGLDGSRILMKWYSNFGWNAELGGYSEMLEPTIAVIQLDSLCNSKRYPYSIAGAFGKGWDNIHNYSYDLVWGLQHRTRPGSKVFLSNQIDFFQDFESNYGNDLPEVSLAHGNEWDLNLASLSEVSGLLKRSMEKLRTAETIASIAGIDINSMSSELKKKKEDFLYGISIYNLHGWTADGPVDRQEFAGFMRKKQQDVTDYVEDLYDVAVKNMGERINADDDENMIFIFNSLNWERRGMVDILIEKDFNALYEVETGKIHFGSIIKDQDAKYLRVWVTGIPSVGYKIYQLKNGNKSQVQDMFYFHGNKLETPYYSVDISRSGAISRLYDKQNKKNWTNGYINDLGCSNHDVGEAIQIVNSGSKFISLSCKSNDPVKHESLITFYADDPRIDFQNTIKENFDELLHCSFEFNVENPEVWHEEVGAIIKAKLASAGGHYANRMARYDYLTLNHFVNVGNQKESITLSNADCLFFRLGNSTPENLDMNSATVHILVGGQVNKDINLGIIEQGGDTVFHQSFSLKPQNQSFDSGNSMRFALDHQNPIIAGNISHGGEWTQKKQSFLKNDNMNVILWTFKPGEEEGVTMRLWNMEAKPVESKITFNKPIQKVSIATHVETDVAYIPVEGKRLDLRFNQHQLKTYRLWLK